MRLALPAFLIVLALIAPAVQAKDFPAGDARLPNRSPHVLPPSAQHRALAIALTYWHAHDPQLMRHHLPFCGRPRITWAPLNDSEGGEDVGCQITMASNAFVLPSQAPLVCEVLLHEVGHALGLAHSSNPYSPMFWTSWRIVPACAQFSITADRPHRPGIASGDA